MAVADTGRNSTQLSRLNAIVDVEIAKRFDWLPVDLARAFLNGGARFLQLRAKQANGAEFLKMAETIATLCEQFDAMFIVNDRADISVAARADGVHVGQEDLSAAGVRRVVGDAAVVGLSTHSAAQLEAGAREPVDYLAIGPVFGTSTKATGYQAVGLEMVRHAARTGLPIVAIGGITLENAPLAIKAGAASVAVITDLLAGHPESRVRAYLQLLTGTETETATESADRRP